MTPGAAQLETHDPTTGLRLARWLIAALAVAVVAVAVTVEVTAVRMSSNGSAPTPIPPAGQVSTSARGMSQLSTPAARTPAPSRSTTSRSAPSTTAPAPRPSAAALTGRPSRPNQAQPVLLRYGTQQGRSQIPWSQVGRGWYLAAPYSATSGAGKGLYLVNPIGGRYVITDHLPNARDAIAAWSPDGERVMLSRQEYNDHTVLTELELATGRVLHTFDAGHWASFVSYTRPQGQAVLVLQIHADGKTSSFQRLGTNGSHQLTYPSTVGDFTGVGQSPGYLYSADGTELLIGGRRGIALLGNDGHLIRVLPAPAVGLGCWPVKWWNSSTVLEACQVDMSPRFVLRLQQVAGGTPTELADGNPTAQPMGFVNAWKYSRGVVLSEGSGCGPGNLDVLHNGVISRLRLPAGVVTPTPVYGVDGDAIAVPQRSSCGPTPRHPGSVISVNLVTGAITTLFTGSARLLPYPWQQS